MVVETTGRQAPEAHGHGPHSNFAEPPNSTSLPRMKTKKPTANGKKKRVHASHGTIMINLSRHSPSGIASVRGQFVFELKP